MVGDFVVDVDVVLVVGVFCVVVCYGYNFGRLVEILGVDVVVDLLVEFL